jgi:hypothetical protein
MKIEQIYTGCIAQAAYYLESNGEAAIFDPLREVQPYLDRAKKDNAKIKYIQQGQNQIERERPMVRFR